MTTEIKPKRKRLTPQERLARMGERYLKMRDAGKTKYTKSGDLLKRMISAGLILGQPIIVNGEPFELVDNFDGEKTGGWATVYRFALEPVTKKRAAELKKSGVISNEAEAAPGRGGGSVTQEDQAIYANLASTRCVCSATKRYKESFCKTDYYRLGRTERSALYERLGYCDRFRAACKKLGLPLPKLPKPKTPV